MIESKQKKTRISLPSDTEILITRTFDAPRDRVWEMWTQSEHLKHWWGPRGWTLPVSEMDFRVGGAWFYCMQGPDGMRACGKSYFLEIEAPERIVIRDYFVDSDGNPLDGFPVAHLSYEFIEQQGKTLVKNITRYDSQADRDQVIEMGMEAGIEMTHDRLEDYLLTF